MSLLSQTDVTNMRGVQVTSLHDTCTLRRHIVNGTDDYGMPLPSYVETFNVACGFKVKKATEAMGNAQVTDIMAELRLPIGTEIDGLDQVTIVKRYGDSVTPIIFKVDGTPIQGVSGIVVQLIKATV